MRFLNYSVILSQSVTSYTSLFKSVVPALIQNLGLVIPQIVVQSVSNCFKIANLFVSLSLLILKMFFFQQRSPYIALWPFNNETCKFLKYFFCLSYFFFETSLKQRWICWKSFKSLVAQQNLYGVSDYLLSSSQALPSFFFCFLFSCFLFKKALKSFSSFVLFVVA